METVEIHAGPSLLDKLSALRHEPFDVDGTPIELVELTALEATALWDALGAAEAAGNMIEAYTLLVFHGAHHPGGARIFDEIDQVRQISARYLVPMGESMLKLCDMGLDPGNVPGARGEISPTG